MKKLFKYLLFMALIIGEPNQVSAEDPDPCGAPDEPCPVDGGLALLIGTGILIGIRQAKQLKG